MSRRGRSRNATSPWPFVGMALMAAAFFLYAASATVGAPWWGVLLMLLVWTLLMVLAVRWWTPHPTRVAWVGVLTILGWFVLVWIGVSRLGWSP